MLSLSYQSRMPVNQRKKHFEKLQKNPRLRYFCCIFRVNWWRKTQRTRLVSCRIFWYVSRRLWPSQAVHPSYKITSVDNSRVIRRCDIDDELSVSRHISKWLTVSDPRITLVILSQENRTALWIATWIVDHNVVWDNNRRAR